MFRQSPSASGMTSEGASLVRLHGGSVAPKRSRKRRGGQSVRYYGGLFIDGTEQQVFGRTSRFSGKRGRTVR